MHQCRHEMSWHERGKPITAYVSWSRHFMFVLYTAPFSAKLRACANVRWHETRNCNTWNDVACANSWPRSPFFREYRNMLSTGGNVNNAITRPEGNKAAPILPPLEGRSRVQIQLASWVCRPSQSRKAAKEHKETCSRVGAMRWHRIALEFLLIRIKKWAHDGSASSLDKSN